MQTGENASGEAQGVLGFDLDPVPQLSRVSFTVTEANQAAFAMVQAWPAWPAPFLNLVGPGGSGKSHLARIWAEQASAQFIGVAELDRVGTSHLKNQFITNCSDISLHNFSVVNYYSTMSWIFLSCTQM